MRKIIFRGKRLDNGEWLYGDLMHVNEQVMINPVFDEPYEYDGDLDANVDPETVGQYTGLKDKNSKEIYEGDITWDEQYEEYCVVEFKEGCFWYTGQSSTQELYERCDQLEVVGNIHDNPEILK